MRALACSLVALTGCSLLHNAVGGYNPARSTPHACDHSIPHKVDVILAVPFALEAIVIAGFLSADTHSDARSAMSAGLAITTLVGGLFIGSAVYGSSRNADCETELGIERAIEAESAARAARAREEAFASAKAARVRKDRALELGKQAAAAARAGECATVTAIDPQLCTLDADYHDSVFVHDVSIAKCLGEPRPCPPDPKRPSE